MKSEIDPAEESRRKRVYHRHRGPIDDYKETLNAAVMDKDVLKIEEILR